MVGETETRLLVAIRQVYLCELEFASSVPISEVMLDEYMNALKTRPSRYTRLKKQAERLLSALDGYQIQSDAVVGKPTLSGEELWKTIVDVSNP